MGPSSQSAAEGAPKRKARREPARVPLIAVSVLASVAATTGTMMYAYPETLAPIREGFVLAHDASGDLMLAAVVVYLWVHLKRTWRMRKQALSWWTGIVVVAVVVLAGGTGIYGQLAPMPSRSTLSLIHAFGALAMVAIACFHGAYGLRRLLR